MTDKERIKELEAKERYLYIHYLDDWTKPFYVGKGLLRRVKEFIIDENTGVFYYGATDACKYYKIYRHKLGDMLYGKIPNTTNLRFV